MNTMPYIPSDDRPHLDFFLDQLIPLIESAGELNYCLTRISVGYLLNNICYSNIATVIGTLNLVISEIEQRLARPYEYSKLQQNGDVPEFEKFLNEIE